MSAIKIIAEAGVNHNGDIALAKELIRVGADAGVDYVKFQTFVPEAIVSRYAKKASYQQVNFEEDNDSQLAMLRKLVIPKTAYSDLIDACVAYNTKFLSTPFDFPSIDFLSTIAMDFWKIPSGELTNLPYLRRIASSGRPVVLSTGMAGLDEVGWAIDTLLKGGLKSIDDLTVLHCTTQYPTPKADVNLLAMVTIKEKFGVKVGYSDHTQGIEVPIAAAALGAVIIEKHFTLDRSLPGPDHKASLEPNELKTMVESIRNVELSLGDGVKDVRLSEKENVGAARKSIVASRAIRVGEILTEDNLAVKRPGTGLSPRLWDDVIGKVAIRDFAEDELIEL